MTASVLKFSKFREERGEQYTTWDCSLISINFVLDKVSVSKKGVIRGFHGDDYTYKLISCLYGTIKLVVFDISTETKQEFILSDEDDEFTSVLVPPRHLNAHQCLTDKCVFHYKWDQPYDLYNQYGVSYKDEFINPQWYPIPEIISERDSKAKSYETFRNSSK